MRYDRWSRPLLTLFGTGRKRTTIRVADGLLHVKFGWIFQVDVPLEDIRSAELQPKRCWAVGLHQSGGRWIANGSRRGVVEIELARPVTPKKGPTGIVFADPVRVLYLSVTEPESFVAALT